MATSRSCHAQPPAPALSLVASPGARSRTRARTRAAAFIGATIFVITGFGLGWVNTAADYSRYLPRRA